jgi:hypothetical protein
VAVWRIADKKGSFSWAARSRGATPPVHPRVRLHTGLFNNTLPPCLASASAAARPLAWTNIDCDLYAGTVDALQNLGPRMCAGTLLHFHELLKDRYWKVRASEPRARRSKLARLALRASLTSTAAALICDA